jgi:acyl-CoA reductase-like NAD-dependent aldehyde dehydrogenase
VSTSSSKSGATWAAPDGRALSLDVRPFIDGKRVASASSQPWSKFSPATGKLLMQFPEGCAEDVDAAVRSARAAVDDGRWSDMHVSQRRAILLKLADLVQSNAPELALMESLEVGKPIRDSENIDLAVSPAILRYNAEAADKVCGTTLPSDGRSLCFTTRGPRGVIGAIVGWNFPLALAVLKVGPALATGNSMVLKPSELSSLSALRLAELAIEAGVPPGVLNVVPGTGPGVGEPLVRHLDVDMISFTGSTATGRRLTAAVGQSTMKPLLLECGGKSPNIVFDDCPDLDAVADAVTARMYWNQGQVCTAGSRLLVQDTIRERLLERIVARARALLPGNPMLPTTGAGPLISEPQMTKVLGYIESGRAEGARLLLGGGRTLESTGGYYVETTIFDGVRPEMKIAQEEIFGPVLSVIAFRDATHACQIANSTMYGLSATVWTRGFNRMHAMIKGLRAGEIDIKATATPSAGAALGSMPLEPHKQSGVGIEGGLEGLQSYTVLRSVKIFAD